MCNKAFDIFCLTLALLTPTNRVLYCVKMTPVCISLLCKDKSHYCLFKVSFSICIIVPLRKCLRLNFWFGLGPQSLIWCPSCSPIVHPSFPTMAARKAIFGRFNGRKWAPCYTRGYGRSLRERGPALLIAEKQKEFKIWWKVHEIFTNLCQVATNWSVCDHDAQQAGDGE